MNDATVPTLPLVFVGPMGAGKSSVARGVAHRIDMPFVDTDAVITAEHGPISEIFAEHGEEFFRAIERDVVSRTLREDAIVSLGGGAVIAAQTRELLLPLPVVYLTISAEAVARRLGGSRRPLLASGGIQTWSTIFATRKSLYEQVASLTVDTSHRPKSEIVDEVTEWWRKIR